MVARGCKNCGHESLCDGKLYKDFGEDKEVLVCYHWRCDTCEKDYARWSETHDDYNMYTDEAISTP